MAEDRKVFLIPYPHALRIKDIPEDMEGEAYSVAMGWGGPKKDEPAWATARTLDGLKALGLEPEILVERRVLPVFHGSMRWIETQNYEEILSCMAYARWPDEVAGVAYVGWNCENEVWQMHHSAIQDYFFYYSREEARPYVWLAVCNSEAADFLCHLYHEDENMLAWLQEIGFVPLDEGGNRP